MSFQNNSIWLPNCSGSLANGDMCYYNSTRVDYKRGHHWFIDTSEQELLFNKKQAIESLKETSGPFVMHGSLCHDDSMSQSGCPTSNLLFSLKPVQSSDGPNKNIASTISAASDIEKKGFENQLGNDSSICLSMSRGVENPLSLNTGLRKVKVHEVRISDNCLPEFVGNSFCPGEKDKVMSTTYQRIGNNVFPLPTYNTADGNNISGDPALSRLDRNCVSVGQASSKRDDSSMLMNRYCDGLDDNLLSIGQAFSRGNYNIGTVGGQYDRENGSFVSIGPNYSKVNENFFSADPFCNKVNETFVPTGSTFNEGDRNIVIHGQQDATIVSLGAPYNKEKSNILSMFDNPEKGQQTTVTFGGLQDIHEERDHSGRLISRYDALLNESFVQSPGALRLKDSAKQPSENVTPEATSRKDGTQKKRQQKPKKGSSNNFPSNVKSLLSTGILDGVPVKYVSWSREKNLRGVVKGTGYLCSCLDCKLAKVINAYEFERHAGCKTKHPNNHIYFENGKTIYAVVQELKNTPQDMLFEVIQNVTGSPVNQKNFNTWKASYQAATRELQRIYGKDDMLVPS